MSERLNRVADYASLARRYGERIAVADAEGSITYARLLARAAALAHRLVAAGVRPGDPVASLLRNAIPAVWASLGITLSGAAETPLNPGLNDADRRHCLTLARVRHVVTSAEFAPLLGGQDLYVHRVEDVGEAALDPDALPAVEADAWGRIGFTSGTTGAPKGIVTSQRARWTGNLLQRACMPTRPGPASRLLLMTPFSHGASLLTHAVLDLGGSVMLLEGVDAPRVLGLVERAEVDEMFAPPTVLAKIVAAAEGRRLPGLRTPTLRTIYCGTAVLSPALYARAHAVFGPVIRVTYGKTEVVNPITVLEAAETEAWYAEGGATADACVGWPATGVELLIRTQDDASAKPAPSTTAAASATLAPPAAATPAAPGELGEVLIRATQMLAGTIRPDGYVPLPEGAFHETGDLGYLDARGRLHLVGRAADVIKTGGYKVAPEEVERALAQAAGACEVAAFGLPSEYWGEVIVAVVERPGPGWEAALREAASAMTGYKRPRALLAVDSLPRNAMLKVSRRALCRQVLDSHRLLDGPHPTLEPRL